MPHLDWKSIRWKRITLVLFPIALFLTVPVWHHLFNSTAYADMRCVMQDSQGEVMKGAGQAECTNNGKQTLVLRVKE